MDPAGPHYDGLVRSPVPLPAEWVEAVEAEGTEEGEAEEEAALALGPDLVKDEAEEESGDQSHWRFSHLPHATDRWETKASPPTFGCDGGETRGEMCDP